MKILIVDDDQNILRLYKEELRTGVRYCYCIERAGGD
jgi:DNA-binding response OmpR family regulator